MYLFSLIFSDYAVDVIELLFTECTRGRSHVANENDGEYLEAIFRVFFSVDVQFGASVSISYPPSIVHMLRYPQQ